MPLHSEYLGRCCEVCHLLIHLAAILARFPQSRYPSDCRLTDPQNDVEITSFKVHRILFCCRGNPDSAERNCLAFTCSHGETSDMAAVFQCHVFRCDLSDAVGKVLYCFKQSFHRLSRKMSLSPGQSNEPVAYEDNLFTFDMMLEIKEDDGKGKILLALFLSVSISLPPPSSPSSPSLLPSFPPSLSLSTSLSLSPSLSISLCLSLPLPISMYLSLCLSLPLKYQVRYTNS